MRCEHLLPAAGRGRSWSLAFRWLLRDLVAVAPSRTFRVLRLLPNTCVSTSCSPGHLLHWDPHGMPPLLPEVPHPPCDAVAALRGQSPCSASPWIYCVTLGWYLRSEVPQNLYCSYQVSEGQEDVGMVSFCCRSSADPLVFVSSETRSAGIYFPEVGSTLVWILGGGDWGKEGETFPSAMTQCL